MKKGWTKIEKLHHFFNGQDNVSLCNRVNHPFPFVVDGINYTKFYMDPTNFFNPKLCLVCKSERKKQIEKENHKKQTPSWELKEVTCSEDGCKGKGVAYVSTIHEEKPHYCIIHNMRVIDLARRSRK